MTRERRNSQQARIAELEGREHMDMHGHSLHTDPVLELLVVALVPPFANSSYLINSLQEHRVNPQSPVPSSLVIFWSSFPFLVGAKPQLQKMRRKDDKNWPRGSS